MLQRVIKFPRSSWLRGRGGGLFRHRPLFFLSTALSSSSCDSRLLGFCGVTTDLPQRSFHSSSVGEDVKQEATEEESVNVKQRKTADEQKKTEGEGQKEAFGKGKEIGEDVKQEATEEESVNVKQRKTADEQKKTEGEGQKEAFGKGKEKLYAGFLFVLATISNAFISLYFGSVQRVQHTAENTMRFLTVQDIRESTVVITNSKLEKNYVHRPAVEKELIDYIEGDPTEKYLVVYGPKGAGKSSVVLKTLSGKKGVALVEVANYADQAQLSKMVAQAVMNTKQEVSTDSDEVYKTLAEIEAEIINDKNADKGNYPTIVFEVERGGTDEDIRLIENVRSLSKKFSTVANVIIILSEAIAVTTFGRDRKREKYMYVGDMTREEAKQLLEKLGKHLNDTDFTHLYDNIGGRPVDLTDFASSDVSVKDFVRKKLENATFELENFPHRHRQLLSLLKQHPEGVRFAAYHVDGLKQFGKEVKESNVVYFDIDQKVFKLQSRALELALKDYPLK